MDFLFSIYFSIQEGESHANKILIQVREESTTPLTSKVFTAKARVYFDSEKYYIISGILMDNPYANRSNLLQLMY